MNTRKKVLSRAEQIAVLTKFGIAPAKLEAMSVGELRYAMRLYHAARDSRKTKRVTTETRYVWSSSAPSELKYRDYLQTPHWLSMRVKIYKRANYKCEECGKASPLQVHHKTYERVGKEELTDLIALCAECHSNKHPDSKFFKTPAKHGRIVKT